MKRIALVVPALCGGGGVPSVARFVKDVILRSRRYELMIVSLSMSSVDPCSHYLRSPYTWSRGITVSEGGWEGFPFTHVGAFLGDFEFQRYLPRSPLTRILADCDLIQVVCGSPAWANAVLVLGKPVALQVATRAKVERRQRDASPKRPSDWWRRMMTEITDRLDDRALRHVDAIQVENPWMLDYARNLNAGRAVDIRYAPPGINAELFRPLLHRNVSKSPYILCVGRLDDPRKNVGLLLFSYALLSKNVRDQVQLLLAGSSPPPPAFWKLAEALKVRDRVSYISCPSQEELVRLYQEASVFVLPSDEEGLGVVVLEAMACAIPVVSTRSGGPDGIISDGEDGYLVPLDAASEMAARLQLLLENPSINIEMGLNARATIEAKYDERVAGAVFVKMWDQLLGNT